ncbi:hypothetical protein DSM43276_03775 [Mycobacteroides salmoniphilum]|nr:hypothetical protein DSM43276_03775 [Mycobacteroides salmoniphilum]
MHTAFQRPHLLWREMRLHETPPPRVVVTLGLIVADRSAEKCGLTGPGSGIGRGMRPAHAIVVEQLPDCRVSGD